VQKNKTVVYFCHDELYVNNAVTYEFLIDVYVTHNLHFYRQLRQLLPHNRENDIYYLPYGIELANRPQLIEDKPGLLKIIFIARLHEKKGVYDLLKIYEELTTRNVHFQLTIIGNGPEKNNIVAKTSEYKNINFSSPKTTEEVLRIAAENHIYVLPSYLDGIPVALLEAMSVGLVPIIYKFNEGITEVIQDSKSGYIVNSGDYLAICDIIKKLDDDRDLLKSLSRKAKEKIEDDYNADFCFQNYYDLFKQFETLKKPLRELRIKYDGILDYPFIPQILRNTLRKLKYAIK